MKISKKIALSVFATMIVGHGVFAMHHKKPVFKAAQDVQFEDIIPGVVSFATVSGDRAKGSHGTFVRIPAGQATPPHIHGAAYHAVIIQGELENPITDVEASNVTLSSGSYYYVPANSVHVTRCAESSDVDCISYFYQDVPFDFTVAK